MTDKTESYIVLKPIAERFSRVASSITDDEIKTLIKDEMKERIRQAIDFSEITDVVTEYVEDNRDEIAYATADAIIKRLELPSDYKFRGM